MRRGLWFRHRLVLRVGIRTSVRVSVLFELRFLKGHVANKCLMNSNRLGLGDEVGVRGRGR